jgi:alpha-L-fucosidase 2
VTTANAYNIIWHTPSRDSSGSMPLGNGDIALNAWVEAEGDLVFYIAKSDAWSDECRLVKVGRVRLSLEPNPFREGQLFRQELVLRDGEIRISAGEGVKLRVWVDANQPVVHVEVQSESPINATARTEIWRTATRALQKPEEENSAYGMHGGERPVLVHPDILLSGQKERVIWCHRNEHSIYAETLQHQHLEGWLGRGRDPLLHRTFGAVMSGAGLRNADDATLVTHAPRRKVHLQVVCHTAQTETLDEWTKQATAIKPIKPAAARQAHRHWWLEFWDRSYIHASGCPEAELVSRGYALQRYMVACAGRGSFPIKFNGSLFTVDAKEADWRHGCNPMLPQPVPGAPDMSSGQMLDADFRRWGGLYWHQNTRLPYWGMLAAGDFDMMPVFFRLYLDALPLAQFRTEVYFGHGGAFFPETMYSWGAYGNSDYDYMRTPDTTGLLCANPYIRHHFQGALEVLATMLQFVSYGGDMEQSEILRFADAVLLFYSEHFPRDVDGKLRIEPSQALETYLEAVNPLPDIAALQYVLDGLLRLPGVESARQNQWRSLRDALPALPTVEVDGYHYLAPAETHGRINNVENPELYAVFPYEQFTVGRPNIDLARRTYGRRVNRTIGGWSQDGIQAAMLGLTDLAKAYLIQSFSQWHPGSRFPAFWGPGYDWIPDNDHGSAAVIAMQRMLLQSVDGDLQILPAWPKDWDVEFKLHAPGKKVVECISRRGQIRKLDIHPPSALEAASFSKK